MKVYLTTDPHGNKGVALMPECAEDEDGWRREIRERQVKQRRRRESERDEQRDALTDTSDSE